jgi:hypothetical protein
MPGRISRAALVLLLLVPAADAKNKKRPVLPDYVLTAQSVLVVIHPGAGEPVNNATANQTARENVEKALTKWGRFRLVLTAQTADLIVAIRKGHAAGSTIGDSPGDDRPIIYQPGDAGVRIGGQHGRTPDLTDPGTGRSADSRSADRGPHLKNEIGPAEDTFEVYRGGGEYPLDAPSVWRYMAKDALNEPAVAAVEQFRTAINEAERQRPQKP